MCRKAINPLKSLLGQCSAEFQFSHDYICHENSELRLNHGHENVIATRHVFDVHIRLQNRRKNRNRLAVAASPARDHSDPTHQSC